MSDPFGHGTRVAGNTPAALYIVAGIQCAHCCVDIGLAISKTFGIAKKATAIAVRVSGATGTGITT